MTSLIWDPNYLVRDGDRLIAVQVPNEPGPAYTYNEWRVSAASYAVDDAGNWTKDGQPLTGDVERILY